MREYDGPVFGKKIKSVENRAFNRVNHRDVQKTDFKPAYQSKKTASHYEMTYYADQSWREKSQSTKHDVTTPVTELNEQSIREPKEYSTAFNALKKGTRLFDPNLVEQKMQRVKDDDQLNMDSIPDDKKNLDAMFHTIDQMRQQSRNTPLRTQMADNARSDESVDFNSQHKEITIQECESGDDQAIKGNRKPVWSTSSHSRQQTSKTENKHYAASHPIVKRLTKRDDHFILFE